MNLRLRYCILSHKNQINFIPAQSRMLQIVVSRCRICCSAASCCMMEERLDWTRVMPRPPARCRLPFRIFHHSSHHHQNDHLKPRKHGLTLVIILNRTCISSQCQNHRHKIYNLIYENNFKTPTVLKSGPKLLFSTGAREFYFRGWLVLVLSFLSVLTSVEAISQQTLQGRARQEQKLCASYN